MRGNEICMRARKCVATRCVRGRGNAWQRDVYEGGEMRGNEMCMRAGNCVATRCV